MTDHRPTKRRRTVSYPRFIVNSPLPLGRYYLSIPTASYKPVLPFISLPVAALGRYQLAIFLSLDPLVLSVFLSLT